MSEIFTALPGMDVAPDAISASFETLWGTRTAQGGGTLAADKVRAMQINLVLHFGFDTTPADAIAQFRTAVRFAARYPSRVVVLCPRIQDPAGVAEIRAKIYGECFPGRTRGDERCCEFVLLNYSLAARSHLESQVSTCLAADLPLYYWAHRFTDCRRLADYHSLLERSRRLIVDTAAAPADVLEHAWPGSVPLRDLAHARILPLRQSIGQFLARYDPRQIIDGLESVVLSFEEDHAAEGRALGRWLRGRLEDCGASPSTLLWRSTLLPSGAGNCLGVRFSYRGSQHSFSWTGNCTTGVAQFGADLGSGNTEMSSHISLCAPEQALAEAMFA